jgi:putative transposase
LPWQDKQKKSLDGYESFINFVTQWEKKYSSLKKYKAQRNIAYFTYIDFPALVQRSIYTTNWIERLNRKYKRTVNMRTSMPSEKSVVFCWQLWRWRKQRQNIAENYINLITGMSR